MIKKNKEGKRENNNTKREKYKRMSTKTDINIKKKSLKIPFINLLSVGTCRCKFRS